MHELSVTQSLLDMVISEAKKVGASSIEKINIVVGELTGIVDESVQFYFEIISVGTLAEGAKLSFKYVPAEFYCGTCGHTYNRNSFSFKCPKCGSTGVMTKKGNELYIENIEVVFDGDKSLKKHT